MACHKKNDRVIALSLSFAKVIPAGFEPTTHSLEGCCSIQLSYGTSTTYTQKLRIITGKTASDKLLRCKCNENISICKIFSRSEQKNISAGIAANDKR